MQYKIKLYWRRTNRNETAVDVIGYIRPKEINGMVDIYAHNENIEMIEVYCDRNKVKTISRESDNFSKELLRNRGKWIPVNRPANGNGQELGDSKPCQRYVERQSTDGDTGSDPC